MIALLRHGTLPREQGVSVEFWRLKEEFELVFPNSVYGSIQMWLNHLKTDGGHEERFQCCTNSSGADILNFRATQGHSGENLVDPSLLDNVLNPNDFFGYICFVGGGYNLHCTI